MAVGSSRKPAFTGELGLFVPFKIRQVLGCIVPPIGHGLATPGWYVFAGKPMHILRLRLGEGYRPHVRPLVQDDVAVPAQLA